ncbi:radical SAM domain iron-sulfur cluster-binding oxidoreductase with cobalamin-binding-like domain [Syntrophotalea carbinolica DSM 2380]|uniref:Radical SAM domain iron-sulfur cluster-binding oxidoreductase with cobalamin-binding-like domain n=1 Tax=Syntrophotalea carbinolica (strain DSM 2380 / NBRC 103641 / GraBd1) TaxID=338963 RepID=Q3A873_SYNC1|nr:radical SAM protein [Syntrophotalea carbinolica]ABA87419.1 radical SAM domain iron-sulfur cluster-binding oxidoreductase with cobalamin-binding-like domain [Syntrophotalea carbinolica DSM 2380]
MQCPNCENLCQVADGDLGGCGQYRRIGNAMVECYPDRYLIACPIVIETMPMLHFHPGGKFLQISTVGCNFDCPGCISTTLVREMDPGSSILQPMAADQVLAKAIESDCSGIAFLMNDPLASLDTFLRVARAARSAGLLVGCATNGSFTEQSLSRLLPYLDFINIGIKGLTDEAYRACGGRSPEPVLRNVRLLHQAEVHVEVACMHRRDNRAELQELARRVAAVSPTIPLQVMRYIPLESADPEWEPTIRESEEVVLDLRRLLRHVYLFNSPGTEQLHSLCPECGAVLLRRDFYGPMGARLLAVDDDGCAHGPASLDLRGQPSTGDFREADFQGGYPFTRALEIVQSMLIALGVRDPAEVVHVWETVLGRQSMRELHHSIQQPSAYLATLDYFGALAGRQERAATLIAYIESRLAMVAQGLADVSHRPRVYYAMGKPLFAIKGQRFENQLVQLAGGYSVNRQLELSGRPGMSIDCESLIGLNPEVMVISAFLSSPVKEFHAECLRLGLDVEAVHNLRIYTPPVPASDFGGPRWVLGLMFLANILHPECFQFDLAWEATTFYREFYDMPFNPDQLNRSFGKPSNTWCWASG